MATKTDQPGTITHLPSGEMEVSVLVDGQPERWTVNDAQRESMLERTFARAAKKDDKVSIDRLNKLHPKVRSEAIDLYRKANAALTGRAQVRITQGLRTFDEQAALYAQGRTKPGPKVTNAKPGSSYHNYGLAVDFVLLIDGKEISWSTTADFDGDKKADWMEVVGVFKAAGWKWGGDFKSIKDYPHFEKGFGYSVSNLLAGRNAGKMDKDGYVKL